MWQNDWSEFAKVIGVRLRQGAVPGAVALEFGSQMITWTGVLKEKWLDDLAPMVTIGLAEAEIQLKDSVSVPITELSVPVARDAVSNWQGIPVGTCVSFTAILGGSSIFSPVEVKKLSTGRTLLMIRLSDGRPVHH
jgi:hypothetical protein